MLTAFSTIIPTNSCGDDTITIPSKGTDWKIVSGTSPVPGGKTFSRNFLSTDYVKRYSEANKDFIQDTGKPEISVNADFFATVYNLDDYSHDDQVHSISWTRSSNSISKRSANELMLEVAAMEKNDLFTTVIKDGSLPRKTFSMGEACDKRFYLEAKKI